jgi:hypothetical protein
MWSGVLEKRVFKGLFSKKPSIRTSHIIKGRIPSAIGKPVKELKESEKTLYYERMMFKYDVPSIVGEVNGNELVLNFGGVRAYNKENLYSKKAPEKFKLFIGFKNMVCTNLCVSSDGLIEELKVSSINELEVKSFELLESFNYKLFIEQLRKMNDFYLTEKQFANFIGRCRMYPHLPNEDKDHISELFMTDGQINNVVRGYYNDEFFSCEKDGSISTWSLFNLLTESNKSSYIDSFLTRGVNAFDMTLNLLKSIESNESNWFLDN